MEIDKTLIPSVSLSNTFSNETANQLSELGVSAYNPSTFQDAVINQFDKIMTKRERAKESRKLVEISTNISRVRQNIALYTQKKRNLKKEDQNQRKELDTLIGEEVPLLISSFIYFSHSFLFFLTSKRNSTNFLRPRRGQGKSSRGRPSWKRNRSQSSRC